MDRMQALVMKDETMKNLLTSVPDMGEIEIFPLSTQLK
jgi:hypothetical protein